MPRLLLVRHGVSAPEGPPRYWGHTDLNLTAEGLDQAERLRERLESERVDRVFASDLSRCRQTAEAIVAGRGLAVELNDDLREISFGECEGLTFAEIDRRFPGAERFWAPDSVDLPFPGGESVAMLAERVKRFVVECVDTLPSEASALLVSHGGPLKILVCLAMGMRPEQWWQLRLDLGSLSLLDLYSRGAVLSRLNDVSHLG